MKRIILCLLVASVFAINCFNVFANEYSANLDIDYNYDEADESVYIKASINDIAAENGIMYCDYNIYYDDSALELVNATVNIPDAWKAQYEKGVAENWSREVEAGHYSWILLTVAELSGIKEDNQIFITLEFKPLKSATTTVSFEYSAVTSEVMIGEMYEFVDVAVNSVSVNIDTSKPDIPDINENSSTSVSVIPDESGNISGDISGNEIIGDVSSSGGTVSIPGVPVKPNLSDGDDVTIDVSADIDNNGNSSNLLPWIIIGAGILVGVAVTVYVLKFKKV